MKNMKLKRALLVLTLLVMTLSAVTGGTIAWFTDTVESNVNTISAGNLDIELYVKQNGQDVKVDENTSVFTMPELWEPGAVATSQLTIKNEGNLAFNYRMAITPIEENAVNVLEAYKLSDVLKVALLANNAADWTDRDAVLTAAKKVGTPFATFTSTGKLNENGDAEECVLVVYWEPSANDNNWNVNNGKTTTDGKPLHITLGLKLEASQESFEHDSFGPDYDADANTKFEYDSTKSARANADALEKMIEGAAAGSVIAIPNGKYEFYWAAGSPIDIAKSVTLIGESEEGVEIIVPQGAGFGFRISDSKDPNSNMHVVLKNMTLKSEGATRQGIYAKYNVTVDLYNISVSGFNGDIMLDNGNMYDSGFVGGTTTTVNAYNVKADKVLMNATPCHPNNPDYSTAPVGYARFNYDTQSDIGSVSKQDITMNASNLFVNGECINGTTAVVYASPANIATTIAAAPANATIMLQAGTYDEIKLPANTDGLTIKAAATPVAIETLDLNAAKNVLIEGVIFDAANAEMLSNGSYTSINVAASSTTSGAKNVVIRNCQFVGIPVDVNNYFPIYVNDASKPTSRSSNLTIENCEFLCNAKQYLQLNYLAAGTVIVKDNVFGGTSYATLHSGINATGNSANWNITGNTFYNWNPEKYAFASSRNGSHEIEITITGNTYYNNEVNEEGGIIELKSSYLASNTKLTIANNTYTGALAGLTDTTAPIVKPQ